jgi:hypothetical protein
MLSGTSAERIVLWFQISIAVWRAAWPTLLVAVASGGLLAMPDQVLEIYRVMMASDQRLQVLLAVAGLCLSMLAVNRATLLLLRRPIRVGRAIPDLVARAFAAAVALSLPVSTGIGLIRAADIPFPEFPASLDENSTILASLRVAGANATQSAGLLWWAGTMLLIVGITTLLCVLSAAWRARFSDAVLVTNGPASLRQMALLGLSLMFAAIIAFVTPQLSISLSRLLGGITVFFAFIAIAGLIVASLVAAGSTRFAALLPGIVIVCLTSSYFNLNDNHLVTPIALEADRDLGALEGEFLSWLKIAKGPAFLRGEERAVSRVRGVGGRGRYLCSVDRGALPRPHARPMSDLRSACVRNQARCQAEALVPESSAA